MSRLLVLAALIGCAPSSSSTPTSEVSPPPAAFTLTAPRAAARGGQIRVTIDLPATAPNQIEAWVLSTDGDTLPPHCPPVLGGACLDIVGNLTVHGRITVTNQTADYDIFVHPFHPTDEVQVQVVILAPSGAFFSNSAEVILAPLPIFTPVHPDFDGSGTADLVIGTPDRAVSGAFEAGQVAVMYSNNSGLVTAGTQLWDQDTPFLADRSVPGYEEHSGRGLAWGDFDGDGYDDLAIGAPGEDIPFGASAGLVTVIYGEIDGLNIAYSRTLLTDFQGAGGTIEHGHEYGSAMASGDFDGDGYADLVVGAPGDTINGYDRAGKINVVYGTGAGLDTAGMQWISENELSCCSPSLGDRFGDVLAVGDFNDDGYDDIAVGSPDHGYANGKRPGAVFILRGSASGISVSSASQINPGDVGAMYTELGGNRWYDGQFGRALAVGDFDSNGVHDLAIGEPYGQAINHSDTYRPGAVHVVYGTTRGLVTSTAQHLYENGFYISGLTTNRSRSLDRFGAALAAGDFDAGGSDDLAVGVPGDSDQGVARAGRLLTFPGGFGGLDDLIYRAFEPTELGWDYDEDARLGTSVVVADFNGDAYADIAVSAPGADALDGTVAAGRLFVIYSDPLGVPDSSDVTFDQSVISGDAATDEEFAAWLR